MTYTVRTTAGPAVLTEGLGRRFGETHALRELDLAVEPGTVLGLLGHNGAGKTTAVRILTTLLAPSEGRAFVAGHDVAAAPGAVREQVSLAGQQASLDERLTGRENLMLLGRLQRISKADAAARTGELLERFGIAHAADRQVGTYSGGMRRRLDLAACLVVAAPGRLPRRADHRARPREPPGHVGRGRGARRRRRRARCSPPSTSKRPTASPTRSSCSPRAAPWRPARPRS